MSLPARPTVPPSTHRHLPSTAVDSAAPTRSKITGGLAALACAACCALPLLIAAGVLTGAGAAILEKTLIAVAAGLAALALGMWWLHRRRSAQRGQPGAVVGDGHASAAVHTGCGSGNCGC